VQLGAVTPLVGAYAVAVEEFPIDRMLDEAGRPLKDVSHVGSRWLTLREIERLMRVPGELLETILPGDVPTEVPGATARLSFARLDTDRSGLLEADELEAGREAAPLAQLDADGDRRVTLSELVGLARLTPPGTREEPRGEDGSPFLERRIDPDGDLARLLDGLNPFSFDRDGDRKLERKELEAVFVAALDLDGDGSLSPDELSRHPGPLRELRFGGARARELFDAVDPNHDGRVTVREYRLRDEDLEALDVDGDGVVHLGEPRNPWWERRGFTIAESEWPKRQAFRFALPPAIDLEGLEALLDADRDGVLTQRELKSREDLFLELDRNGDGRVPQDEYRRAVDLIARYGVDATLDGHVERWDLDGDGEVERGELPEAAWSAIEERRAK
jgi:Ca2+-binding EF-hand superfamily protein